MNAAVVEESVTPVDLVNGSSIPLQEITAVAADGNCSRVHLVGSRNFHVCRPVHEWAAKLEGRGFIQPGRSLLLLPSAVQYLESRNRDENYLHLTGGVEPLKLGRIISIRVRQLMGL